MTDTVIVGAGLAGHRTAVALRKKGYEGNITVIGDEPHMPYDRPPLSKQVLQGVVDEHTSFFPCEELSATWVLDDGAVGLDQERRLIRLASGLEVPYDALVIATGRRARGWPGMLPTAGVHTLRSLDDCRRIKAELSSRTRVVIIGAGFVGCEVAATLRLTGVEAVTVLDIADRPMVPLGPEAGVRAARIHGEEGVRLVLGATVQAIEGDDRVEGVRLAGGEMVPADLVLLALGSLPNSEWLTDSGLDFHHGAVACDQHLVAQGTTDIFAAGDIAAFPHQPFADHTWVEHWTNAREMASLVAGNLLARPGDRKAFETIPTFWSNQYDVQIKSVGFIGLADSFEVLEEDSTKRELVIEARSDGDLIGAITFNRNRKMIEYTRRMAQRVIA